MQIIDITLKGKMDHVFRFEYLTKQPGMIETLEKNFKNLIAGSIRSFSVSSTKNDFIVLFTREIIQECIVIIKETTAN